MKKWIALFLVFSFLFILPINASNNLLNLNSTTVYTIDQPYEYPIIPGTPQWLTLKDHQEMIDACEIPSEIVSKMTTDALLKSYLNYPLSVDMYAYDSLNNGFEILKSFHMLGLDELISRPDLPQVILNNYESIPVYNSDEITSSNGNVLESVSEDMSHMTLLEVLASQIDISSDNDINNLLNEALFDKYTQKSNNKEVYGSSATTYYRSFAETQNMYEPYVIYTPNGSPVPFNITDSELPATKIQEYNNKYSTVYPLATRLREPTKKYNCHSYAWYSTLTSNIYWVWDPTPFMNDGSYMQRTTPSAQYKIYYLNNLDVSERDLHSGIVESVSGNTVTVLSKWGEAGLYRHSYNYCPYYFQPVYPNPTAISYWTRY